MMISRPVQPVPMPLIFQESTPSNPLYEFQYVSSPDPMEPLEPFRPLFAIDGANSFFSYSEIGAFPLSDPFDV
jgi:hypothetical protein